MLSEEERQWFAEQFKQFRGEMIRRLETLEQRQDYTTSLIVSLDGRMPIMSKAIADILARQAPRQRSESAAAILAIGFK